MFVTAPNSVLLSLGPLTVRWYGLLVVAGFLAGLFVCRYLFKKYKLPEMVVYDLFFYVIIFGLVGARFYYVLYAWDYYSQYPLDIFKIWQGGLAIHGAIIAALVVIYFFAKKRKFNFWQISDIVATCLPLSLAIGRFGNYFNQELFGKPTNLPWGIPIDPDYRPVGYENFTHFHPTFIYEAILDIVLFGILFWLSLRRVKQSEIRNQKSEIGEGHVTLLFLVSYSVIRFMMEFLRLDYSPVILGIRWEQIFAVVIIIISGVVWWIKRKK